MLLLIFFLDNSDCFVDNVAYCCGNEIDNVATETIELCQIECQNHPQCSHWTYLPDETKPCYLKSAKGSEMVYDSATSGPKFCQDSKYKLNFKTGTNDQVQKYAMQIFLDNFIHAYPKQILF